MAAGRPMHVSQFAGLRRGRRPPVTCPECGRRLTLKLGNVLRHHAAHAPRDVCAATRPETALHWDLKFHIAARLESAIGSGAPLVIQRHCAGVHSEKCDVSHEHPWTQGWDSVVVESRVAAERSRPDILLERNGQQIGAIEVLVSHAVGEDKAAALGKAGIPWIEVRGDAALLADDTAWTLDRPLPVVAEGNGDAWGAWRCDRHAASHHDFTVRIAAERAAEAEASRHRTILRGARVVDVYHADGSRDRVIYRVEEQLLDGQLRSLVLRCGTREIAIEPADDSIVSRRGAWALLRERYAADVERLTAGGAFSDSPMRWASGDAAANVVFEALSDVTPADPLPLATRYPRRWFYNREQRRWFMPEETRDVRWDRADPDAFAAHPAWAANRARVRERPAPAYAWKTFVFASRPAVHTFGRTVRATQHGNIAVLEVDAPPNTRRAVVVLTGAAANDEVRAVARALDDSGVEHVWLSHPRDWTSARADIAWAPAGRDGRGIGVVVVDGVGVYRAEQFMKVFARGERRVTCAAIKTRSADRVARLG